MHTRAQVYGFVIDRLALLDGTANDLTYLTQAGHVSDVIMVRGRYQWLISPYPDHVAQFNAKMNVVGRNAFQEIDNLLTLAQQAGGETARTNYLQAASRWCQIVNAIILHVVGGDDTW
jgi:hypothetical protein